MNFQAGSISASLEADGKGGCNIFLKNSSDELLLPEQALETSGGFTEDFYNLLWQVIDEIFPENGEDKFEFATFLFGGGVDKETEETIFAILADSNLENFVGVLYFENISLG
jgi:hypothetical protein